MANSFISWKSGTTSTSSESSGLAVVFQQQRLLLLLSLVVTTHLAYACTSYMTCNDCLSSYGRCAWCKSSSKCVFSASKTSLDATCGGGSDDWTKIKGDCPLQCSRFQDCSSCASAFGSVSGQSQTQFCSWCLGEIGGGSSCAFAHNVSQQPFSAMCMAPSTLTTVSSAPTTCKNRPDCTTATKKETCIGMTGCAWCPSAGVNGACGTGNGKCAQPWESAALTQDTDSSEGWWYTRWWLLAVIGGVVVLGILCSVFCKCCRSTQGPPPDPNAPKRGWKDIQRDTDRRRANDAKQRAFLENRTNML